MTELVPDDFDWRAYLGRYDDLARAGVVTADAATQHWREYGRAEGRWGGAPTYETRNTLACTSIHSLYLRATGDLVCWDDAGSDTVLQRFDPDVDYARDVYLGDVFNDVRLALWSGKLPFGEVCQRCLVLRANTPHSSFHLDNRVIEQFQIEPSYRCSLDCPGCVPLHVRNLAPPRDLDPRMLEKILGDLVRGGVTVRAFDFQGHGEPLMNRGVWALTRMTRDAYPNAYVTVTTNAHGVVREAEIAESGLDEVVCAIDGVDDASFTPYRVNGRFDLAYRFMRDLARIGHALPRRIKVIWKYILFEHCSASEQLLRAQQLAEDADVDELVFVFTRNGPRARDLNRPADVVLRPSSIPVSFRFHEPDVVDLAVRIDAARGRDGDEAGELALSVARNLARFLEAGAPVPDAHQRLIDELFALHLNERDRLKIDRMLAPFRPAPTRFVPLSPSLVDR